MAIDMSKFMISEDELDRRLADRVAKAKAASATRAQQKQANSSIAGQIAKQNVGRNPVTPMPSPLMLSQESKPAGYKTAPMAGSPLRRTLDGVNSISPLGYGQDNILALGQPGQGATDQQSDAMASAPQESPDEVWKWASTSFAPPDVVPDPEVLADVKPKKYRGRPFPSGVLPASLEF